MIEDTKHIGIVACSSEGAALCYRTLCAEAAEFIGPHMHPEISLHHHPLAEYLRHIRGQAWEEVARLMADSGRKLAAIGADFIICPDNTIHQAFEQAIAASPVPWLHIVQEVAGVARKQGYVRLGVTGTLSLVTSPVYPQTLAEYGIACEIPGQRDVETMEAIIHDELVYGVFREASRLIFNEIIGRLGERGCDAVVLACTEIPLLVDPGDCPLPTIDSTRVLARAALAEAISSSNC